MIENELDNGPQEPPVESAKKNNTRILVKRTLAIAGLALVVYFLYSIVPVSYTHLTLPTICSV